MGRLTSGSVSSLIGGLTQLADNLTVAGQLRTAKNCRYTVEDGLGRRYPTTLLSETFGIPKDEKVHVFQYEGDTHILTRSEVGFKILNVDTRVESSVVVTGQSSYTHDKDLELFECSGGAFLLNRAALPLMRAYEEPPAPPEVDGKIVTTYLFKGAPSKTILLTLRPFTGTKETEIKLGYWNGHLHTPTDAANTLKEVIGRGTVQVLNPDPLHGAVQLVIEHTAEDRPEEYVGYAHIVHIHYGGGSMEPTELSYYYRYTTSDGVANEFPDAIAWVTVADFDANYRLFYGPNSTDYVEYKSPHSDGSVENKVSSGLILGSLLDKLNEIGVSLPEEERKHHWQGVYNNWGYLSLYNKKDPNAFISYASDLTGQGHSMRDGALYCIKHTIDRPELLPPRAPEGYTVNVRGIYSDAEENTGYWMKFATEGDNTHGIWKETCAPKVAHSLDERTLPHKLSLVDDVWTIAPCDWEFRKAGDNTSNDAPEFIGKPIKAITSYRNRLMLITEDSVSMSEAGEWENFFRTTVITQKASDRIDFKLDAIESYDIRRATSSNSGVILWDANHRQFLLSAGDGPLTPASFRVQQVSEVPMDMRITPVDIENTFRYIETSGASSKLKAVVLGQPSKDFCGHVPTLLPTNITSMACSGYHGLTILCNGSKEVLACHTLNVGGQELMHSWSVWEFPQEITYVVFNRDNELLLFTTGGILKMVMSLQDEFWDGTRTVMADGRKKLLGRATGTPYETIWSPVRIAHENSKGLARHLKIRRLTIGYVDTTEFDVTISRKGREESSTSMTGRKVGVLGNVLGRIPMETGAHSVPIMADVNSYEMTVKVSGIYDAIFQAINWEGFVNQRSLRW